MLTTVLCTGVVFALVFGLIQFSKRLLADARAHTAAEAAVIAGVMGGQSDAAKFAKLNGATLVSLTESNGKTVAVVEIGGVRAIARATTQDFSTLNVWPSPTRSSP